MTKKISGGLGAAAGLLLLTQLTSCVTLGRFEELEARVVELEQARARLDERTELHETRLEHLNTILKRSEDDLRKGYAATTSTVEELESLLRRTMGTLESTQYLVERDSKLIARVADFLDKQHGTTLAALPDNLPAEPDKLFAMGEARLQAGQWREARAIFREFLARDAQSPRGARAQLLIGESFVGEKDYERALGELKVVWAAYRDQPAAPLSLLRIAEVLVLQGECSKARSVYQLLIKEASGTEAATKAREEVKGVMSKCR